MRGLEKLTDFSKTLEKMLLTRHDDYKKRVEAEQINQAFMDGGDPHKNEKFKEEEAQLEAAHEATVAVSTEYQNKGGLLILLLKLRSALDGKILLCKRVGNEWCCWLEFLLQSKPRNTNHFQGW